MNIDQYQTINNEEKERFELQVGNYLAKIDYKVGKSGAMYMIHTEVPEELKGNGVGHKIIRESLLWIEENEMKVVPSCPMVRSFIQDHESDFGHLLAEHVKL